MLGIKDFGMRPGTVISELDGWIYYVLTRSLEPPFQYL